MHVFCLRHLLANSKVRLAALAVGNQRKCRGPAEFDALRTGHQSEFLALWEDEEQGRPQLKSCLEKVGLSFTDGFIQVTDLARWRQVWMIQRVDSRLPATMNALECFSRHCNEVTPRFNTFWGSMH
jgi:hypothetical protein